MKSARTDAPIIVSRPVGDRVGTPDSEKENIHLAL
jgi:hypothetical protein